MRSPWDDNFPDTIIDRKLSDATSHPDYLSAKSGNVDCAYRLAIDLVSNDAIVKLSRLITENTVIVPVHAEEAVGVNMIPLAVVKVLSDKLNLPIELSIV